MGLDLLDFFRGKHPWGKLFRLLEQLPQGSAYWAAKVEDEELAAHVLAANPDLENERRARTAPDFSELSYQNQLLMAIVDSLGGVIASLEALGGVKPAPARPLPRPKSALARVLSKREAAEISNLEAEVYSAMERHGRG